MLNAATKSADDTRELGAALAPLLRGGDILLLAGDLGAGKTTFTQGLAGALGVTEQVTSPTFTLLHSYAGRSLTLLHADVYRLGRLSEIADLGLTELVDGEAVAVIEWGDVAEPVLPADFVEIRLAYPAVDAADDDRRTLSLRAVGPSWSARLDALSRALARWSVDQ